MVLPVVFIDAVILAVGEFHGVEAVAVRRGFIGQGSGLASPPLRVGHRIQGCGFVEVTPGIVLDADDAPAMRIDDQHHEGVG